MSEAKSLRKQLQTEKFWDPERGVGLPKAAPAVCFLAILHRLPVMRFSGQDSMVGGGAGRFFFKEL